MALVLSVLDCAISISSFFRAALLPLVKFMEQYNLSLEGYGFFRQNYTLWTPEIFTRLGEYMQYFVRSLRALLAQHI